jgi:hypothetical protein
MKTLIGCDSDISLMGGSMASKACFRQIKDASRIRQEGVHEIVIFVSVGSKELRIGVVTWSKGDINLFWRCVDFTLLQSRSTQKLFRYSGCSVTDGWTLDLDLNSNNSLALLESTLTAT